MEEQPGPPQRVPPKRSRPRSRPQLAEGSPAFPKVPHPPECPPTVKQLRRGRSSVKLEAPVEISSGSSASAAAEVEVAKLSLITYRIALKILSLNSRQDIAFAETLFAHGQMQQRSFLSTLTRSSRLGTAALAWRSSLRRRPLCSLQLLLRLDMLQP